MLFGEGAGEHLGLRGRRSRWSRLGKGVGVGGRKWETSKIGKTSGIIVRKTKQKR